VLRGQSPADVEGTLTHGGLTRRYLLHVPPAPTAQPGPLVVVLHGGGASDDLVGRIRELTRLDGRADAAGGVVVYPEAVDHYWNDGRGLAQYRSQAEHVDDVGFITALVDHVARERNIDSRRVYVTGASNGAMMALRLACERPERFAAVAVVAGNLPTALACRPAARIPAMLVNGTDDPAMPWSGGEVRFGRQRLGSVLSAEATASVWATANGCGRVPVLSPLPDRAPRDGTRVVRADFPDCRDGADVVLYRVEGGGHTWPGGPQQTTQRIVGRTSRDIDATDLIWAFFGSQTRTSPSGPGGPDAPRPFGGVERIEIRGYNGNAMEPAISKDGRTLVFNDFNPPQADKNLFWARRVDDRTFQFMGALADVNSPEVDISPSLDAQGVLYYTSLRQYPRVPATLYRGSLAAGRVTNAETLPGPLYRGEPMWASLDPDVTPDGRMLVYVHGRFGGGAGPREMDIRAATWRDGLFVPEPETLLASINTAQHLEYAPAISADGLELFFTRGIRTAEGQVTAVHIYRAARRGVHEPFGEPAVVGAITGFVEGPSLSADGRTLYFHRKDGDRFVICRASR
jgi:polyhydroxybutyrate depolymerase